MESTTTQGICILGSMCLLHESTPRMHTLYLQNLAINTSTHIVNIRRSLNVVATAVFWAETQITSSRTLPSRT